MPGQKTARKKVLVTLSAIVVALVVLLPAAGNADVDIDHWDRYVVQAGDTLWDIAMDATPLGGDVRHTLAVIRDANVLETSEIHPGQELQIPPKPFRT